MSRIDLFIIFIFELVDETLSATYQFSGLDLQIISRAGDDSKIVIKVFVFYSLAIEKRVKALMKLPLFDQSFVTSHRVNIIYSIFWICR
jgi:hypothetical protein